MTPTVGRIVHVLVDPFSNNGSDVAPAIITRVWSEESINIRVFLDGSTCPWLTSILLYDSRENLEKAIEVRDTAFPDMRGASYPGAFWPART